MLSHLKYVVAGLMAIALAGLLGVADVQAQGYFKDKTLTMIVPHSNTGGFGQYTRLLSPAIEKELKAKAVRVEYQRGAGGLLGVNNIWAAKPDGLTFGLTSGPTIVLAQLAGADGVKYNALKFTYLGRAVAEPRVVFVAARSSIKSLKDVIALNRPFRSPSQGVDDDFYGTAVLGAAFGFEVKFVTGYEGAGDTNLSIMRGDTDGRMTSWTSAMSMIKAGEARPIVTMGYERYPEFPDVPTALEHLDDPQKKITLRALVNISELHRTFIAPDGLDPEVAKELRAAISAVLANPQVLAEAKKHDLPILPMDGATQQKVVAEIYEASSAIPPILKAAEKSLK
ncbi:MAG: tripartite tricarboxylate transporter substrate-binding protein [Chloroflexota bacterium]